MKPGRDGLQSAVRFSQLLAAWPDQKVVGRAPGRVALRLENDNVFLPVTVSGEPRNWIFDTGANWCITTESEARRLRMEIRETDAGLEDATGKSTGMRIANARTLELGSLKLGNVLFIVVRDDQQPFQDLGPRQRGVIGLPVLLALGAMSWDDQGNFELGASAPAGEPNLAFDGAMPITLIEHAGRRLPVILDTGADLTHLWPKFANEFAESIARGKKITTSFSGVAHQVEIESIKVPELRLRIGGKDLPFRDATVLLKQEGGGAEYYYGNLGTDLLCKAKRGTLDFRRMRLVLE